MKRKQGLRLLCLALVLVLLSGCGAQESITVLRQWEPENRGETESSATAGLPAIGLVADVGGIQDESFNQGAWEGLQALQKATGAPVDYRTSDSPEDFRENFESLIRDGSQLIWGIGYDFHEVLLEVAREHPDRQFAIVDYAYREVPENVTCVVFRAEEPSFLVGYIAGRSSLTRKVGFVGGVQGENIDPFQYGFQAGVDYAGKLYTSEIQVMVEYAGSYEDPEAGKRIAKAMFEKGCDIVYHAAGATGLGVIEAAEDADAFAIGVDRDQAYLSPAHVLTSAVKNVGVAVNQVSQTFLNGGETGGSTLSFGLVEGAEGVPEEHPLVDSYVYDAALAVSDAIKAGRVDPPANQEEYAAFRKEWRIEKEEIPRQARLTEE